MTDPGVVQLASVDGAIGPSEAASISVLDEGLLRGDGVFEVMRLYGGRPFALGEHLERLQRSAANLRLELERATIEREIAALLATAGSIDALLRIIVTRAGRRLLLTEPLPEQPATVRLSCVTYSPSRVLDGVKSLSYAANMLATRLAQERGFDEALLVTPHGHVLEAPTSSFFWVRDGELLTPPLSEHILASITRQLVLGLAPAREANCTVADLAAAQEAFLVSTVRSAQPVGAIDDQRLEPGPVCTRVGELLRGHIARAVGAAR